MRGKGRGTRVSRWTIFTIHAPRRARPALYSTLRMHTLIADDDEITRLLLSSALIKFGRTVGEVKNGHEVWEAWRTGEKPLGVSDWMMPDLDGLEFCRRIRAANSSFSKGLVMKTSALAIMASR